MGHRFFKSRIFCNFTFTRWQWEKWNGHMLRLRENSLPFGVLQRQIPKDKVLKFFDQFIHCLWEFDAVKHQMVVNSPVVVAYVRFIFLIVILWIVIMDKLIKKFQYCLIRDNGGITQQLQERFSTASAAFRKEFRKTKTLLAHGPTIQRHWSKLNYVNTRSNVDCIWEKIQIVGKSCNDGHVMKQAEIPDKLERWSSQFKHSVPAINDFLALNSYGKFTTTEHSFTLNVSSTSPTRNVTPTSVF